MDNIFKGIKSILFCDESKFYLNDNDFEDAIYYFGVAVEKKKVPHVSREIKRLIKQHKIRAKVFHSSSIFKESRPRIEFMNDLTQVIIENRLKCFCYKYSYSLQFEVTKLLSKYNNDIINFDKAEFQAVFYFLTVLNDYLSDRPKLIQREILMFFDRNVYGTKEMKEFNFPKDFVLKQMTFIEKSKISLLCLPDFFGYMFRKSKKSQNNFQFGDKTIESSQLVINSYKCLVEVTESKLFHHLDPDDEIMRKALNIYTT